MDCKYFGVCGGCLLRDIDYDKQVENKEKLVNRLFSESDIELEVDKIKLLPASFINYYRNKMEFSFGEWDSELVLGLYAKGKFYQVVDIEHCYLQSAYSNKILNITRVWAKENRIAPYHKKRHDGILRNLIIRETRNMPGVMINLVVKEEIDISKLVDKIKEAVPLVKSFFMTVHAEIGDVSSKSESRLIYGEPYLEEKIGDCKYRIGPYTFFQNNIAALNNLFGTVKEWLGNGDLFLDLYSGVGCFGIYMADNFEKIIGIEENADSIEKAKGNAELNNVTNCEFIEGDVDVVSDHESVYSFSNVSMVVDPPRAGLSRKRVAKICKVAPNKIVYVSCNPKTLIKDLEFFESAYKIVKTLSLDMFPQTEHIETVVLLEKRENPDMTVYEELITKTVPSKKIRRGTLLNKLKIGRFRTDKDINIVEANNTFYKMFGLKTDKEAKTKVFDLPIDEESFAKLKEAFANKEGVSQVFIRYKNKKEEFTSAEVVIKSGNGGLFFEGLVKNVSDIALHTRSVDKSKDKANLVVAEEELILEHSTDTFIITNRDGIIEYVNKAFEETMGYSSEEVLGQNMRILNSGKQDLDFYKDMWATINEGKEWDGFIINKNKDQVFCYQDMKIIPVRENNQVAKFIAIQKDNTDFVHAERSLIDKDNELGGLVRTTDELIAVVRDRNQSPLEILKNKLDFIMNNTGKATYNEIKECERICHASIETIENLVNNLRGGKSVVSMKEKLNMTRNDILSAIEPVIEGFKPKAEEKNIEIIFQRDMCVHKIFFDIARIGEVVSNLLDNAIKFSPENSVITVFLKVRRGFVDIEVIDQGSGISPDYKQKIFSKFVKVGRDPLKEGKGLGLADCKDIIEAHNGRIWVQSKINRGSKFIFRLPIERRIYTREVPSEKWEVVTN